MTERLTHITLVEKGVHQLLPGEITQHPQSKCWYVGCPGCHSAANLGNHTVTESNGIVTVSPSILCYGCNAHYFIENNQIRWC